MNRYADPHRCPDCGSPIAYGQPACTVCHLPLSGEVAQRLYQTLVTADGLLTELRASAPLVTTTVAPVAVTAGAPPAGSAPGAGATPYPIGPRGPLDRPTAPARGLSATSVPKILLGLGAACVLGAALVFLAVTWSVMGVAGRTATLVVLTLLCGLLAAWFTRRDLRGAAEALGLISLGLLTLDVFGARDAGWFGDIADGPFFVLTGALLLVAGGAAALGARRTPVQDLTAGQAVAAIGLALATFGVLSWTGSASSTGLVAAVVVAAALTYAAHRLDLTWTRWAGLVVTVGTWLLLVADGVSRTADHATISGVWADLHGWPLLAAACLAAVPAALPRVRHELRVTAAAAGYAVLVYLLVAPALDEGAVALAWVAIGTLLVTAALGLVVPHAWRLAGVVVQGAASVVVLSLGLGLVGEALLRLGDAASTGWAGPFDGRLPAWEHTTLGLPLPWQLPLLALAVVVTLWAVGRALPREITDQSSALLPAAILMPAAAAVLAASAVGALALQPVPIWSVVALSCSAGIGLLAWWLRTHRLSTLALAALFLLFSTVVSSYNDVLTGLTLLVVVAAAATVATRSPQPETSAVAAGTLVLALAGDVFAWAHAADAQPEWSALLALGVLAAVTLPAHLLPARTWSHPDRSVAVAGLEVGAAVAAVPSALTGVLLSPVSTDLTWTAVYLTVIGATVAALGLLRDDRSWLLPIGGLLLVAASWVRLWEIGVREPEPYTLPTAAVLAAVGLWRLHRRPQSGTAAALSPALGLALVPSLLWALSEEAGLRALLLGSACLALVIGASLLQWAAPVVWGAVVGGILTLWLAAPYVGNTVPRWVLLAAAGAVLILLGVTWERRLRDARHMVGYVRELR